MLYSYKGNQPAPLPFRIVLSSGFTRTDPATFTSEEIEDAGFIGPYQIPEYDSKIETLEWGGYEFSIRPYNNDELEAQWEIIRDMRSTMLKDSDWTQVSDYDLNLPNKGEWAEYRQELRNLTISQNNPFDIIWPSIPEEC